MKNYKYDKVINILNNFLDNVNDDNIKCINDMYDLLNIKDRRYIMELLLEIVTNDINQKYKVKKCENCGKLFIPYKKNDALYCDRISPQKENKTCKEFASKQPKGVQELYRKIYMKKFNAFKRHKDNPIIANNFNNWKAKADDLKSKLNKGTITDTEFEKWLIENDK